MREGRACAFKIEIAPMKSFCYGFCVRHVHTQWSNANAIDCNNFCNGVRSTFCCNSAGYFTGNRKVVGKDYEDLIGVVPSRNKHNLL